MIKKPLSKQQSVFIKELLPFLRILLLFMAFASIRCNADKSTIDISFTGDDPLGSSTERNLSLPKHTLPFRIKLTTPPSDTILLRVDESAVDIIIHLENSTERIKSSSRNKHIGGKEGILISHDECEECEIVIEYVANVSLLAKVDIQFSLLKENQISSWADIYPDYPIKLCDTAKCSGNEEKLLALEPQAKKVDSEEDLELAFLSAVASSQSGAQETVQELFANLSRHAELEQKKEILAWSLFYRGITQYRQGLSNEANLLFHASREIEFKNQWLVEAYGEFFSGLIELKDENFDAAIVRMNKAKALFEKQNSIEGILMCLNGIGLVAQFQGEYIKALTHHTLAYSLLPTQGMNMRHAISNYYLTNTYLRLGIYERALAKADLSLRYAKAAKNLQWTAESHYRRARVYRSFGLYNQALQDLNVSVAIFSQLNSIGSLTDAQYELAQTFLDIGDFDQALTHLHSVIAVDQQSGRRLDTAIAENAIAKALAKKGQLSQALEIQTRLVAELKTGENYYLRSEFILQLADFYSIQQQYGLAKQSLEPLIYNTGSFDNPLHVLKVELLLARIDLQNGNTEEAKSKYESLIELIEVKREELSEIELRRGFLQIQSDIYLEYISLLLEQRDLANTLKSVQLADALHARTLDDEMKNMLDGHQQSIQYKREALVTLEARIQQTADDIKNQVLFTNSAMPLAELLDFHREIDFEKINSVKPEKKLVMETQVSEYSELLEEDEAALLFLTGDKKSWFWLIDKEKVQSYELPSREALKNRIKKALRHIGPFYQRERNIGITQKEFMRLLTDDFLGEAAHLIDGYKKLLVVPDGPISSLPFSSLVTPSNKWMLESKEITYSPSLSVLLNIRKEKLIAPPDSILVVADPIYSKAMPAPYTNKPLERLWFTKREAAAIKKFRSDAELLTDKKATKDNILGSGLDQYSILHFAAHGYSNEVHNKFSSLFVTAEPDQRDSIAISAAEIAQLKLDSDLVVLSACDTAKGQYVAGDGILGLSRAFFEAGSDRVLASLWPVNDRTTAKLMTFFYEGLLKHKMPPSEALRQAKLSMASSMDWQDPYYWAGFILQGDGRDWRD